MTEQIRQIVKVAAVLLALLLVLVNGYYFFEENYVRVQDNLNETHVMTIKYKDILKQEDSFSNRVSLYLADKPAAQDSGDIERIGVAAVVAGAGLLLLGALTMYFKGGHLLLLLGAFASCVGTGCLYAVVATVDRQVRESLVGAFESLFGSSLLHISTTSGTLLIIDLVLAGAICLLTYTYTKKSAVAEQQS
ncbi:MAG: hypothetical protein IJ012_02150 [Clostridia bacterium]|nr:hypothetical protein [Clostridia bacterium]